MRPGTFVKIAVPGLSFENVLRVPETAVYDNSYIYVDIEGRMAQRNVEIVARDGADLLISARIVSETPIITTRIAQAGEGVAIINEGEPAPSPFTRPNAGNRQQGGQEGGEGRPNAGERGVGANADQGNGERNPNRPNRRPNTGTGSGLATTPGN